MNLELTPEAIDDLIQFDDACIRRGLATRASDLVLTSAQTLCKFPYWGPPATDNYLAQRGFRKLLCAPYIAIYRVDSTTNGEVVRIYRVFHQRSNYSDNYQAD